MQELYDVKHALNYLYRDYKYSITAILTIGLTIAVSLFLFSIIYSIQYKPLPGVDSSEKVIWATLETGGGVYSLGGVSNLTYEYFKEKQTSLEYFGRVEQRLVTLTDESFSEQITGAAVSSQLFQMLGVDAFRGRTLAPSDDEVGAQKAVVISFKLWSTLFNKSEDLLGKTIKLDGDLASIVGIMPEGFRFPTKHDLWFSDSSVYLDDEKHGGWNSLFGRMKSTVKKRDVEVEFKSLMASLKNDYPNQYKGKDISVAIFADRFSGKMGFLLSLLKIASFAILFMGCFSACNLIIVRNLKSLKETLIKSALGIPVSRIIIGLLLENFLLCLASSIIGIWLCYLAIQYFGTGLLDGPYWWTLEFHAPVVFTGLIIALVIWILTSAVPVGMAMKQPNNALLSSGRKGGTSTRLHRTMIGFSTIQIFSAFVLMVFTMVLVSGLLRIAHADYGVSRDGLLTAEVKPSGVRYKTLEQRNEYYQRFLEQALQNPDIQQAAVTGALPGASGYLSTFTSIERNIEIGGAFPKSLEMPISDDYFSVMKMKLIEGRNFNKADNQEAEPVAIINQSMANILFPNESALNRQFQYDPENGGVLLTVIGVVPDVVTGNPLWYLSPKSKEWRSQLYRPIAQMQPEWASNILVFRSKNNPYALTSYIKETANSVDPETPIYNIRSFDDFLAENETGFRRLILIFTPASILALAISALSIYSITRRLVLQNTPDIGVMRAVGIEERYINQKYINLSVFQLLVGLISGTISAAVVLPTLPENILITDIATILQACGFVAIIISILVLMASYIPLFNAHKISPLAAINYLGADKD